jgi:hypothetical protein
VLPILITTFLTTCTRVTTVVTTVIVVKPLITSLCALAVHSVLTRFIILITTSEIVLGVFIPCSSILAEAVHRVSVLLAGVSAGTAGHAVVIAGSVSGLAAGPRLVAATAVISSDRVRVLLAGVSAGAAGHAVVIAGFVSPVAAGPRPIAATAVISSVLVLNLASKLASGSFVG